MWTIQLPSGEYLDAVPALTFELNNMVFSGSDTATLPGSFSFPFEVPMNAINTRLLGHVNNVNSSTPWPTIEGCWIMAHGVRLFYGTLTVRSANDTTASVNLIINAVTKLKDSYITELDLEGPRTLPSDAAAHMLATANTPDQYDYAFFPVRIYNRTEESGTPWLAYHNYFSGSAFNLSSYALTPYIRLDYVLSRIIDLDAFGFSFENAFQVGKMERRRLYFLNNRDIRETDGTTAPAWPTEFNPAAHLPKITITDTLKTIARIFCLGIFTNVFRRTIRLVPLREVLQRAPAADWSKYAITGKPLAASEDAPDHFTYTALDTPPPEWPEAHTVPLYRTYDEANAALIGPGTEGQFGYIEENCLLVKVIRATGSPALPELEAYRVYRAYSPQDTYATAYEHGYTPVPCWDTYRNMGDVARWEPDNEAAPTAWTFRAATDNTVGLMIYRGKPTGGVPFASSYVWNRAGLPVTRSKIIEGGTNVADSEISLQWFGEYGLYAQWHAQWNNMLLNGKEVTQSFIIPVAALVEFDFENKIRVGSMDYFVKKIRVGKLLSNSLVQIECTLLSII